MTRRTTALTACSVCTPVSQQWRRILLEWLDAVAVLCRLASTVANASPARFATAAVPGRCRWTPPCCFPAAGPWAWCGRDPPPTAPPSPNACGGWARGRCPEPSCSSRPTRCRLWHARWLRARTPVNALLALERDAVLAGLDAPVWRPPSGGARLDLGYVLERLRPGGELPQEGPPSQSVPPRWPRR